MKEKNRKAGEIGLNASRKTPLSKCCFIWRWGVEPIWPSRSADSCPWGTGYHQGCCFLRQSSASGALVVGVLAACPSVGWARLFFLGCSVEGALRDLIADHRKASGALCSGLASALFHPGTCTPEWRVNGWTSPSLSVQNQNPNYTLIQWRGLYSCWLWSCSKPLLDISFAFTLHFCGKCFLNRWKLVADVGHKEQKWGSQQVLS